MEKAEMKLVLGGNQLSLINDTEEIIKFLEFVGKKSILDEHAVNCRLTACNSLFSVLNEEEDNIDYILKNLDLLLNRYFNKNKSVNRSTLKVYKSRVKSSLIDFKSWSSDPFAWERSLTEKKLSNINISENRKIKKAEKAKVAKAAISEVTEEKALETTVVTTTVAETIQELPKPKELKYRRIEMPIRIDFNAEVTIPAEGFTLKELKRIEMFLYPYCKDAEVNSVVWPSNT